MMVCVAGSATACRRCVLQQAHRQPGLMVMVMMLCVGGINAGCNRCITQFKNELHSSQHARVHMY
jgi:hypothetical protein